MGEWIFFLREGKSAWNSPQGRNQPRILGETIFETDVFARSLKATSASAVNEIFHYCSQSIRSNSLVFTMFFFAPIFANPFGIPKIVSCAQLHDRTRGLADLVG